MSPVPSHYWGGWAPKPGEDLPPRRIRIRIVEEQATYNGKLLRWEIPTLELYRLALPPPALYERGWEHDIINECVWRTRGF